MNILNGYMNSSTTVCVTDILYYLFTGHLKWKGTLMGALLEIEV